MAFEDLRPLLAPRSVALVGASDRAGSVGAVTLRNVRTGGFGGDVFLVNPAHAFLDGLRVYADVKSLPSVPDLGIVATPPDQVPSVIAQLGALGTKAAVILTAGFAELGERGAGLQRRMLAAARPYALRIVGPNCVGLIVPALGLNGGFAQAMPPSGRIALLSQSGAMVTAILDWAQPRKLGFSYIVSLGDMADVDFGDLIAYLDADPATEAIVLYVEGLTHARSFMAASAAVARRKPLLVLKVGRRPEGARAARSHTGALAGSDAVYDAAFRRAGILRVDTFPELLLGIETLASSAQGKGERLAIVTNGGGPGVIATDALSSAGGKLAALTPATLAGLNAILPQTWSHGNPVDMVGDAPAQEYAAVVKLLLQDEGTDAVLALNSPTALTDPREAAAAVIDAVTGPGQNAKTLYTAWLGDALAGCARRLFWDARIPTYETPEEAVQGFLQRVCYQQNQRRLTEALPVSPDGLGLDAPAVEGLVAHVLADGRRWLDAPEAERVLGAYGIPTVRSRAVSDPESAAAAAAELGGPVALKIRSRDVTHKSDAGGVALGLTDPARVRSEAVAMLQRVRRSTPGARVDGFLVQEMAVRPGAIELIVGASVDPVFGPVVLFGHGGTAVERINDTSLELAPLDAALAKAQMARTRVWRLLEGYRNTPSADIDAIARILVRIGLLVERHPAIVELDLNPVLAGAHGAVVLDARIAVKHEPTVGGGCR